MKILQYISFENHNKLHRVKIEAENDSSARD
uniref:Uncharacterized protein n=1 Tax=Rhizophora mucronata TaxID=61149 RepID=A0A2P2NFB3_RHIMU